jgi:hypothetical protein
MDEDRGFPCLLIAIFAFYFLFGMFVGSFIG